MSEIDRRNAQARKKKGLRRREKKGSFFEKCLYSLFCSLDRCYSLRGDLGGVLGFSIAIITTLGYLAVSSGQNYEAS